MTKQNMRSFLVAGLLLWPLLAGAQEMMPDRLGTDENPAFLNKDPVPYTSEEGNFSVLFPPGCGKIVARVPDGVGEDEEGNLLPVTFGSYCDRYQEKGEGCAVIVVFNITDGKGGPAGPAQVVERVERLLGSMGVEVKGQTMVRRQLPDGTTLEGVDVLAAESGGAGESWVRGLLYQGDIYLLSAWKSTGRLAIDPEYIAFFNSFQPGVY